MMRIVLHIDMNSYFASVEQQANPFLRGKPVAVCAYLSDNGCIIASSMEAKKLGIKTGFRVSEAKKLCPNLVVIQNEPAKYRSTTEKIFSLLATYTDVMEPYSIDEAFLDLTGWADSFEKAKKIGQEINCKIKQQVGEWLRSSVGISYTKFLAKFASDIAPKDNVLVITKQSLDRYLWQSKLTDIWGINYRLERRLNELGIYTPMDLKKYPVANLMRILGKMGYFLWAHVNGIEIDEVKTKDKLLPKSVGHSYCLPNKTTDRRYLCKILMKLCEKTGRRLRALGEEAHGVAFGLGYVSGGGVYRHKKVKHPLYSTADIYQEAKAILFTQRLHDRVNFLAVNVFYLNPISGQQSLFLNQQKKYNLARALDEVNDRYGEFSVFYGTQWGTKDNVPDRIGFHKIV